VRVAYGVGRRVGNAVVRNRLRRRLRSILRELDRAAPPGGPARGPAACRPAGLVPGAYLVTVRPDAAELPYAELRRHVLDAAAALGRGSSGPPGRGTRR
jgi:RNase P protein component